MYGIQKSSRWNKPLVCGALLFALAGCGGGGGASSTSGGSGGGAGGGGSGASSSSSSQRAGTPARATYTISWDAVNDAAVTGYRIYFNYAPIGSGLTPAFVDVVNASTATLKPGDYGILTGDTLYVAVASKGAGGLESPVSSQISLSAE